MINLNLVILGILINIIFSIIGYTSGIWGLIVGIFVSGYMVGNLVGRDMFNGFIHGTIICSVGAVIITLLLFIDVQTAVQLPPYVGFKALKLLFVSIVLGSIGGMLGSLINKIKSNNS